MKKKALPNPEIPRGTLEARGDRVAAAVILYRPDLGVLRDLIEAVLPQVERLFLLNNGAPEDIQDLDATRQGMEVIQFGQNLGVGGALSRAPGLAKGARCPFLLTLDQDSVPAPDMVERLLEAFRTLSAQGIRVGGVGPELIDRRSGYKAPFMAPIRGWLPRKKRGFPPTGGTMEVDNLITSGMLAPVSVYQKAGPPRADLFIDLVDVEWSLRLRHHGYRLYGVSGAQLLHSIGDTFTSFLGRQIPVHRPLRHYYMIRNGVFLQTLPYIPVAWKLAYVLQLVKMAVFYGTFLPDRRERTRIMLKGAMDGLRGRLGACDAHRHGVSTDGKHP